MIAQFVLSGNVQMAEDEIKKGVNVNITSSDGQTPLHLAAKYGMLD